MITAVRVLSGFVVTSFRFAPATAAAGDLPGLADVASAVVHDVHDTVRGSMITRFRRRIGGIEVFREAQGPDWTLPFDAPPSTTSTRELRDGQTRANNALLLISGDIQGGVSVTNGSAGTLDVVIDVNGYFP